MQGVPWESNKRLPRGACSVLAALRLHDASTDALGALSRREWQAALTFCDRTRLTLLLSIRLSDRLPDWVRERVERNQVDHAEHDHRLKRQLFEICDRFDTEGTDYIVLKGLSHGADYALDSRSRVQYDIDLYSPPEALAAALHALEDLGYEPLAGFERFPLDHLPAMVRKTGWRWRGDFFDPEIPPSVDLHFRFWDEETELLPAPEVQSFWSRRERRTIDGRSVPVLHPVDAVGYAALHLLRHLLRSSVMPYHVYELAHFLDGRAGDAEFWERWQHLHAPELRRLESISFCLAYTWFGCRLPLAVAEEIEQLPDSVPRWFELYAAAPVEGLFRPNKDELLLHLPLLQGARARMRVLRRRLLPTRMPGPVDGVYVPEAQKTTRMRLAAAFRYGRHVSARFCRHLGVFPSVAWHGLRWGLAGRSPGAGFPAFLLTASLYNLGVFIFVLLYSLYLLDLGHREDFLGVITAAFALGNLAGALPAAWLAGKLGLRRSLIACFAGSGVVSALRGLVSGGAPLVGAAFLGGVLASGWFVLFAPAVSGLTTERKRPAAFSLAIASGIGMGVLGGLLGGRLPGWIQLGIGGSDPARAKQLALICACGMMVLAAGAASRLRNFTAPSAAPTLIPWSPFLARFLAALAVWGLAIGMFNPFFTAYFSKSLQAGASQIGLVFSAAQLVQAGAVLLAPLIMRRMGVVRGVASLQLAAAGTLALLVPGTSLLVAGTVYSAYMSFQAMCEPGAYSLLMGRAGPAGRSGASALNFLVLFSTQSVAALVAGAAIARLGYPTLLAMSSMLALAAAFLFRFLLRDFAPERTCVPSQIEAPRRGNRNWKQAPWPDADATHMSPP